MSASEEHITPPNQEIDSLLSLLDDPDTAVAEVVEARLRSHGNSILHQLVQFADHCNDPLAQQRARTIAQEMNVAVLAEQFTKLRSKLEEQRRGALEDGVFLIAKYGFPTLDVEYYRSELDALAGMLHDRIKGIHSPLESLRATNEFFFKTKNFAGNHQHFLEADNSYINQVLDRKLGIPISLSVLYILVASHRLGLPYSGVSTPGHFLIRYDGNPAEPVFIDAFNGGVILREEDIKRFLYTAGLPYYETFIRPASQRTILMRMLRNLVILFEEKQDEPSKNAFDHFHAILLGSPTTSEEKPQNPS